MACPGRTVRQGPAGTWTQVSVIPDLKGQILFLLNIINIYICLEIASTKLINRFFKVE